MAKINLKNRAESNYLDSAFWVAYDYNGYLSEKLTILNPNTHQHQWD